MYTYEGDVIALGPGAIITADKIIGDYRQKSIEAQGHVVVLSSKTVIIGEAFKFFWETGDFKVTEGLIVANDEALVKKYSQEILGFSQEEVQFEVNRADQLAKANQRKEGIYKKYQNSGKNEEEKNRLVEEYAVILTEEGLIKTQKTPLMSQISRDREERFKKRRFYWDSIVKNTGFTELSHAFFFRLSGKEITRTNGNDYEAHDALWSPCLCAEDEEPAWGFKADVIQAQAEGYVDLYHPVLRIKGVPVLYLPYLKLPMKSQRQSGFLMPSVKAGGRTGTVITQPLFLDFADNADSTVTTDLFQERGMRLGAELRYEQREYSGWSLEAETLRDRLWINERNKRQDVICPEELAPTEGTDEERAARHADRQQCLFNTEVPSNTWRGKQEWQGQTFLTDRTSFVSHGSVVSDHRYFDDLTVGDEFILGQGESSSNIFQRARSRIHYDGTNYYLGLDSQVADNIARRERYKGYQIPVGAVAQSRYFSLAPGSRIPVYGSIRLRHLPISYWAESEIDPNAQPVPGTTPVQTLGEGSWQQGLVSLSSPLLKDQVISAEVFAEAEARNIEHSGLDTKKSSIRSYRSGINLKLPIDGQAQLPDYWQGDDYATTRYMHHIMEWNLGFSVRPYVKREGPYGDRLGPAQLTYFSSDRREWESEDENPASDIESSMFVHRKINLSTLHRWLIFSRTVEYKPPALAGAETLTVRERAAKELETQRERYEKVVALQMFGDEAALDSFVVKDFAYTEPIVLKVSAAYDFELAKRRQQEKRDDEIPVSEPWQGPFTNLTVNLFQLKLTSKNNYNVYKRMSEQTSFSLGLPAVWATSLSFGYEYSKATVTNVDTQTQTMEPKAVRSMGVSSKIIPRVEIFGAVSKKTQKAGTAGDDTDKFQTTAGFKYVASSGCWGLSFQRIKKYDADERDATYLAQLNVIFFGEQRPIDVSAPVKREVLDKEGA